MKLEEGLLIVVNFNQAQEIASVLKRAETYFPKAQTVVVDDGSSDGSNTMAKDLGFHLIQHEKNLGIGAAIRSGIQFASANGYQWVLISSSNGKIKPEEYSKVYAPIVQGTADYVTGSRFKEEGTSPGLSLFRRVMIPIFSFFSTLVLGRRFSDITCGFRAYTLQLIQDSKMNLDQKWLNKYELEYYIHFYAARNKACRITEVPVSIEYSHLAPGRKSKIKPIIGWWSMLRPFLFLAVGLRR